MRVSFCHLVHAFLECSECRERARRESADKTLERALEFPVSTVPVDAPVFLPASWNEPRRGSEFTKQRNFRLHLVTLQNRHSGLRACCPFFGSSMPAGW